MPFTPKSWADRPSALDPLVGESPRDWLARIAVYASANPGVLTSLDAAALVDLETRLSGYTDAGVESLTASLASLGASKAPLASPAFTGNPTAPTPTAGDNDTSIATTAFVQAAVAGGGGGGVTALSWAALSYPSGVGDNNDSIMYTASWAKDDYGIVHLRGKIAGNVVSGGTMFTLPAAACPAASVLPIAWMVDINGWEYPCRLDVGTGGAVKLVAALKGQGTNATFGANVHVCIDGIAFPTLT